MNIFAKALFVASLLAIVVALTLPAHSVTRGHGRAMLQVEIVSQSNKPLKGLYYAVAFEEAVVERYREICDEGCNFDLNEIMTQVTNDDGTFEVEIPITTRTEFFRTERKQARFLLLGSEQTNFGVRLKVVDIPRVPDTQSLRVEIP
ncbi:MAG: hypothetical protein MI757_05475 [Pirellulales bacterium]|nr:hypothetical protein [Pirellulales bacterium]